MTAGIATEIVSAYSAHHSAWPYHYTVTLPGDQACDVRFFTATAGQSDSIIARDGVVAVVNPQNSIVRLGEDQVRAVLAGRIVNWSAFGGKPGAIEVAVPSDDSDEAHALATRLMAGQTFASQVRRTLTAAQIVRWVSSPSGTRSIGIVPFSAALPAKVLALTGSPAPSSLSIADERYPMSVRILASSDFRAPSRPAAALVAFARSAAAKSILIRSAFVTSNGS
jgi:ABC-type phosphate transport system substrate-binding protein